MKFCLILSPEHDFHNNAGFFVFKSIDLPEEPLEGQVIEIHGIKAFLIAIDYNGAEEYPILWMHCKSMNSLCHALIHDPNGWRVEGSSEETKRDLLNNLRRLAKDLFEQGKFDFVLKKT